MSRGHIRLVRRACEAWNAGDISVYRDFYTPDVTADGGVLWPEGAGEIAGPDALISNFESIMAAFDHSELMPEGFIEGDEVLVVPLLWRGVLPGSKRPIEQRLVVAYRFRGGRIAWQGWFKEVPEALDAVELPRTAAADMRRTRQGRRADLKRVLAALSGRRS
jgi:ketosteroid isomerase-like protein